MMNADLPGETLNCQSLVFLESVFQTYAQNPERLPPEWRHYFASLDRRHPEGETEGSETPTVPRPGSTDRSPATAAKQERLDNLVGAFRAWGHLAADIDPLKLRGVGESFWANLHPTAQLAELSMGLHRLEESDLDCLFSSPLRNEPGIQSLREILEEVRRTYCGPIGYEFMHVQDLGIRNWFLEAIEHGLAHQPISSHQRRRILAQLIRADAFEVFVRKKFPGAKVFSIDGSETLVPLLDMLLELAAEQEVRDVVLGMAHRGRLNVLTNVFRKPPVDLFRSFIDRLPQGPTGHGDVRYHLGDDAEWQDDHGRRLRLSLCFNPSHLEYVNPVAMGRVRAMQDAAGDGERRSALTLLIHGDASFAAEGIVYETLNLGRLPAYDTGGVVHVIVNNQIGFTTTPAENRSTTYATDLARAVQIPVLHVNGEDLEAIRRAARLAMDFRARFRRDILIDLFGFRRWGHNETDEPSFTQPRLYATIEKHPRVRQKYISQLLTAGDIQQVEVERLDTECLEDLRRQYDEATRESDIEDDSASTESTWTSVGDPNEGVVTGVDQARLMRLLNDLASIPEGFHVHRKLSRSMAERHRMAAGEESLDWAAAEALAFASLLDEGHPIRLAGQDTQRGTFSHRHAILHDVVNGRLHDIFTKAASGRGKVEIINSPLNEAAAMGFEYGYSLERPNALIVWEAQFGDFVNVAQVIVDQFLSSAEDKWGQVCRLVLLLPHGFEGQGPEHSSARLERFLTLAADENLQIVQPSTPAQYFHFLRRQVFNKDGKPLIIFTPKSLLRSKAARSPLAELADGRAQHVIGDPSVEEPDKVLMCSGKIFYELQAVRDQKNYNAAIVCVDQFYPLKDEELQAALPPKSAGTPVVWVQEEPENMGAWRYFRARFGDVLCDRYPFSGVSRPASASPATGSKFLHRQEQQAVLDQAFRNVPIQSSKRSDSHTQHEVHRDSKSLHELRSP